MAETRKTVAAHERLRDNLMMHIQDRIYLPNTPLPPERQLAEQFQVSRHTVRQALSALEGFGLVTIKHGSGAYVTDTPSESAIDRISLNVVTREGNIPRVVEVRRALEPRIARLAAERYNDESDYVENLRALIPYDGAHSHLTDSHEVTSFHREIAKATQNPVFESVMRTLTSGSRRAVSILDIAPEYREIWEAQHSQIVEAIQHRNGAEAERRMAEHLDSVLSASVQYQLSIN